LIIDNTREIPCLGEIMRKTTQHENFSDTFPLCTKYRRRDFLVRVERNEVIREKGQYIGLSV
jgi:hypothetical protein